MRPSLQKSAEVPTLMMLTAPRSACIAEEPGQKRSGEAAAEAEDDEEAQSSPLSSSCDGVLRTRYGLPSSSTRSSSLLPPLCEDCVPLWGPGAGSAHCDEVRCERCPAPPCDHPALPRCQGPALLLWSRRPSENRLQEGAGLWRRLWSVAQQQSWHVLRAMSRPPPQLPPGGPPQQGRSRFGQLLAETKESVIRELRSLQRWIRGGIRVMDPSDHEL